MPAARPLIDRLADKFTVGDGCWEWTATQDGRGYGLIGVNRRMRKAHRVVYEILVGPIPDGLVIDHLCRNTLCVRPDHLEPVPQGENIRRGKQGVAQNTHCGKGHEFTPENTRFSMSKRWGGMQRYCATCQRERDRERRAA